MKSRKYLNVGDAPQPRQDAFFDQNVRDWFIEVEVGKTSSEPMFLDPLTQTDNIIKFPDDY